MRAFRSIPASSLFLVVETFASIYHAVWTFPPLPEPAFLRMKKQIKNGKTTGGTAGILKPLGKPIDRLRKFICLTLSKVYSVDCKYLFRTRAESAEIRLGKLSDVRTRSQKLTGGTCRRNLVKAEKRTSRKLSVHPQHNPSRRLPGRFSVLAIAPPPN